MAEGGAPPAKKHCPESARPHSGGHWSFALADAVKNKALHVDEDERCIIIKDGYPKSRHHYLVLPKPLRLTGISQLKRENVDMLKHLLKKGRDVADRCSKADSSLQFRFGFHAVPSMRHFHMHVVSQDFDSVSLKNKKHWNSFTTDFFRPAEEVIAHLEKHGEVKVDQSYYNNLLKSDLKCHRCKTPFRNLPSLKAHIRQHS